MRKLRFLFIVLSLMWGCSPVASSSEKGSNYHGKVIDAETGDPIEGAVVVVVWHKKPHITMDGPQYFHEAREVLTDGEGKFSVNASPRIDWDPFTYVLKDPSIAIFKPGYGPFPTGHVKESSIEETKKMLLEAGAVVKLPRLKTQDELRKFTSPGHMWISIEENKWIPNLMRLINIQRKRLGLQPYPGF